MFRALLVAACAASAAAFAPSSVLPRAGARVAASKGPSMQLWGDGSAQGLSINAVPFLQRPPALDGTLAGDVGFDPVGFSNYIDLRWLREAELKHGRVCMLGVTGLIAQEFVTLPMFQNGKTPVDDFFVVPAAGLWQVFFAIGAIEFFTNGFKLTPGDMFSEGREAGDLGFDPLGCGKNPEALARRRLVEVKNGRLAMIAFGGMLHQQLLTKQGTIEQLVNFKAIQ
mmetsp:Transcript_32169/g.72262  ORF Transcript_32169/g.72262 Transcript_32169/m.72262 type:complete len:226 (-) Transcript_32169:53-730(-)